MSELNTPFSKGMKSGGVYREIVDVNGVWVFDCFDADADEILRRINGPELLKPLIDKGSLFRVDPAGCGCVDCICGESKPIDRCTNDELVMLYLGILHNATSAQLTLKCGVVYE